MRPVIVAGNWKMHTTPADAGELAATIARRTNDPNVVRVLCPPFVCLQAVRDALATDPAAGSVAVGAQNVHHEITGPYTGEVSAHMLEGLASWVILGHSERRRDAGETDRLISLKVARATAVALRIVLCVGEQLADREAGRAEAVVRAQVRGSLDGADPAEVAPLLTIAYEPVWAIGTGRNAQGSDAAAMADVIRETLGALGFADRGAGIPVLYGGSVTSSNIDEFMNEPSIDGALVGGASLKPDEMAAIVARAGLTARARAQR
ncbi:MAG: triose-phosphate isomerase [Candidatus Limnocylindrales bacterium]